MSVHVIASAVKTMCGEPIDTQDDYSWMIMGNERVACAKCAAMFSRIKWMTGCDICGDIDVDARCRDCEFMVAEVELARWVDTDTVIERMRAATKVEQVAYIEAHNAHRDYDWSYMAANAKAAAHKEACAIIGIEN